MVVLAGTVELSGGGGPKVEDMVNVEKDEMSMVYHNTEDRV